MGGVVLLVSGVAGVITIAALARSLSGGDAQLAGVMSVASLAVLPALLVAGLRGIAAGHQRWRLIAIERSGAAVIRLLVIAGLASAGKLDVLSAALAIAVTTFVGGFVYFALMLPRTRHEPLIALEPFGPLPRFGVYAAQVWLGAAAGILYSRLDQILMTPLSGVYALGIYAVAASVAEVILLVNLAIRDVIFSVESASPDDHRAAQAARLSTLITVLLGVAIAALSPWAIPILFGDAFRGAVEVTLLLVCAAVVGNPGSVAGAVLSGRGRPGLRSLSLTVGLAVNLILVCLLVPRYGALGAAFATLIASAFAGNNLNVVWLRVIYRIPMSEFFIIRARDAVLLVRLAKGLTRGSQG